MVASLLVSLSACQVVKPQAADAGGAVPVHEEEEVVISEAPLDANCPPFGSSGICLENLGAHAINPLAAKEELICNGGDREPAVIVQRDWQVRGLNPADTVIHYDTIDGKTHVQPSNEVCLYAPRFASVRKVYGLVINEHHDRAAGVELPLRIVQGGDIGEATTVVQPLQPGRKHSIRGPQLFRERALGEGIENAQRPGTAQDRFLPFEDLLIIRRGTFDNTEKARLAERLQAAIAWTTDHIATR